MQPVFVDTFYWIALINPDDPDHDRVTTECATGDRHFEQEGFRALFRS